MKKLYKTNISPRLANEWEDFFTEQKVEVERCSAKIAAAEAKINHRVYDLFQLTPDEVARLEGNIR